MGFQQPPTLSSTTVLPNGTTATTQAAGDNTTKVATDQFVTTAVANAIAGVNPAVAVQAATTTAGNTSGLTYLNGVSGVGATFTGVANTALTVDGFTFTALGQRLLVKNDTQSPSGAFNGIYFVTQIQTAIVPIILTRALDYDQPSDINNTGAIPVVNGTVNALTSWLLTSTVATIGTDPLTYAQFSYGNGVFPSYSVTVSAWISGSVGTSTATGRAQTVGKQTNGSAVITLSGTITAAGFGFNLPNTAQSSLGEIVAWGFDTTNGTTFFGVVSIVNATTVVFYQTTPANTPYAPTSGHVITVNFSYENT